MRWMVDRTYEKDYELLQDRKELHEENVNDLNKKISELDKTVNELESFINGQKEEQ